MDRESHPHAQAASATAGAPEAQSDAQHVQLRQSGKSYWCASMWVPPPAVGPPCALTTSRNRALRGLAIRNELCNQFEPGVLSPDASKATCLTIARCALTSPICPRQTLHQCWGPFLCGSIRSARTSFAQLVGVRGCVLLYMIQRAEISSNWIPLWIIR